MLKQLLRLQDLDLKIEALQVQEDEIPRQKAKFDIQTKRLTDELQERENACKHLRVEQREDELEIEEHQNQISKYEQQLYSVKKNEEYQALLHEIEGLRKQISLKEEHLINLLVAIDETDARLVEDRKRIKAEQAGIEKQCAEIDEELAHTVAERLKLEAERKPLEEQAPADQLRHYYRIRASKKSGPAVVPLNGEYCSGCHMRVTPQNVNEVLANKKLIPCMHCGRLLYNKDEEEAP